MALNCKWIFGIPGIYCLLRNMNPWPLAMGGTTQARKMVAAGEGAPAPSTRAASQPRAVVVQESVGEQSRAEQIRKPACCWVVLLPWPSQHYLPLANSFGCGSAPCSCDLISGVFGRSLAEQGMLPGRGLGLLQRGREQCVGVFWGSQGWLWWALPCWGAPAGRGGARSPTVGRCGCSLWDG